MLRGFLVMLLFCVSTSVSLAQEEKVFSGPQPGEKISTFKVLAFSGKNAGKEITVIGKDHKAPTMIVFVHEITRPGFQLMKPLDLYAKKLSSDGLQTYFVWLTEDKTKTEAWLNNAKRSLKLAAPIVISLDGLEGPGNYGLNRKVTLTILLADGRKTVNNFAIVQPNETDAPKILEAMGKLMKQKEIPTLAKLRQELGMGGRPGQMNPELTALMRQMIQKNNTPDQVKKISNDLTKWAGDNPQRRNQLRALAQRVIQAGYGTDEAQAALKKLVGDSKRD